VPQARPDALFHDAGARVFSVPATASFADVVVRALIAAQPPDDQFALSDCIVLAPNRRACAALSHAFAGSLGGAALLPRLRPLGDVDDDPDVWGAEAFALDLPAEMAPLQRRLELARLLRARDEAEGGISDPVRAIAFADELCHLIDAESLVDSLNWARMPDLVAQADVAQHWREAARFLEIVTQYWPQRLASEGLIDKAARRTQVLRSLAAHWSAAPPQTPVIIAGSTGSIAATRALMGVVARLPKGAVIFPGLDTELDEIAWSAVEEQHPQYHMKAALGAIGVERGDIVVMQGETRTHGSTARRHVVREALAPADITSDWRMRLAEAGGEAVVRAGCAGLTLIEARSEDEEAAAIAVLMRETVEAADKTVALVTPDASLARRVESKLQRWRIEPQMSIGAPLFESAMGQALELLCALSQDCGDPLTIAAFIRHRHSRVLDGVAPEEVVAFERSVLRGPRRHTNLASVLERSPSESALIVGRLLSGIAPLVALSSRSEIELPALAGALIASFEALAQSGDDDDQATPWSGADGRAAAALLRDMDAYGDALGPMDLSQAVRTFRMLLRASTIAPEAGGHPRCSILGPLEARILHRDLVILGGLNEGVWPAPAREDAFLSRGMRKALGLPSPDVRLGLAAHDFAQALCAKDVVMTRALRLQGQPSVASRWVWRLIMLSRAAGVEDALNSTRARETLARVRAMDAPLRKITVAPPRPKPPSSSRPRAISFTEVETLIRDPYAVYARRVLGLRVLPTFGQAPGANHRGEAVHLALERFADEAAPDKLLTLIAAALREVGFEPDQIRVETSRFRHSVEPYCAWAQSRRVELKESHREVNARLKIFDDISLYGRADRIDVRADGVADIIDFKTGGLATKEQVKAGMAPQLTLEAAALARGAFSPLPRLRVGQLIYVQLGGRGLDIRLMDDDANGMADAALSSLQSLLAVFSRETTPFLCKPRVQFLKGAYGDYDLLARRGEWADAEGEG
jgi:ATP-dependent helicase/nuclease subunit B